MVQRSRFVWHKKLEKQIASGVDVKELGIKAEKKKHEQRLVRNVQIRKTLTIGHAFCRIGNAFSGRPAGWTKG